jgi:hypothetical protein
MQETICTIRRHTSVVLPEDAEIICLIVQCL